MKYIITLTALCLAISFLPAQDAFLPPDIYYGEALMSRSAGQLEDYWVPLVKLITAHREANNGGKAMICFTDTASKLEHDDLPNEGNRFSSSFTGENTVDGHGHGHMVAGIATAMDNSIGILGAAPAALAVSAKAMHDDGTGYDAQIAAAIRHCVDVHLDQYQDRIRIISMSLGGRSPLTHTEAALKYAKSKGAIVFAAAGNGGYMEGVNTITYPARYQDLTIAVGSIGPEDIVSYFSSAGVEMDIVTYGENVTLTNNLNGLSLASGTSFSTPLAAAIGAIIATEHYEKIKKAGPGAFDMMQAFFRRNAIDLPPVGFDPRAGYGRIEAVSALQPIDFAPPPGDDDDDPTGDDPAQPDTRDTRTISIPLPHTYQVMWRQGGGNYIYTPILLNIDHKSRYYSDYAYDVAAAQTDAFFRNRAFIFTGKADVQDMMFWVRHFYELIVGRSGHDIRIAQLSATDALGRTYLLTDQVARRKLTATGKAKRQLISSITFNAPR